MHGRIVFDWETKSYCDLKQCGASVYSKDPTTEVIICCWKITHPGGRKEEKVWWWPGLPLPQRLFDLLAQGYILEAHKADFEYLIWNNCAVLKYGFPPLLVEQVRDTMAVACYMGMPAKLDQLSRALGGRGKDPEGAKLISKYSKLHLKTAKAIIPPEDFAKWKYYVGDDVDQEDAIGDYLGDLPDRELPIYLWDFGVNLRGLYLDAEGIENASAIVEQRSAELEQKFRSVTGFGPRQHAKLLQWFRDQGLDNRTLPNLRAETLSDLLKEEDDDGSKIIKAGPARDAILIRLQINKASTSKLDAMLRNRDPDDGRARFQTRYHGAGTGRTTGTGFQPLNLVKSWEDVDPERLVQDISYRNPRFLDAVYGDAMLAISKAGRHWIKAAPGNKIIAADYVSVEAIGLACMADERGDIEAFQKKHPLYCIAGCLVFGMDPQVAIDLGDEAFKKQYPKVRAVGKVCVLAFGYQGALGAWLKFDNSGTYTDKEILGFCKGWRKSHPAIASREVGTGMWISLEDACLDCVQNNRLTGYRQIGFERVDEWLTMILPDGKRLWYYDPQIRMKMPRWHAQAQEEKYEKDEDDNFTDELNACYLGECDCRPMPCVTYMAQKMGQWRRVETYGGKLTENAVQATCRQIMMPAAMAVEKAGYPVILTVYDEIVAEVPIGFGSKEEFCQIITETRADWNADWPISVDGWEGDRYRK